MHVTCSIASGGFRGDAVGDYPPPAARLSPTSSSCGGKASATESFALRTSLLGFLRGGVALLAVAAGAAASLSSSLSSSKVTKVGLRCWLWIVLMLLLASRSKRAYGSLFAVGLVAFPRLYRLNVFLYHSAFSSSLISLSSFFFWGGS
jgi:hypothetical protein